MAVGRDKRQQHAAPDAWWPQSGNPRDGTFGRGAGRNGVVLEIDVGTIAARSRPKHRVLLVGARTAVDAFCTSPIGIKNIDYRGNAVLSSYPAPVEAIACVLKMSGLG